MLFPSHTKKKCNKSFVDDGSCCCNCVNRYALVIDGTPLKFVCKIKELGINGEILDIGNGHGMCEMHRRDNENTPDKLYVSTE